MTTSRLLSVVNARWEVGGPLPPRVALGRRGADGKQPVPALQADSVAHVVEELDGGDDSTLNNLLNSFIGIDEFSCSCLQTQKTH